MKIVAVAEDARMPVRFIMKEKFVCIGNLLTNLIRNDVCVNLDCGRLGLIFAC
jgi:hypothetical protein